MRTSPDARLNGEQEGILRTLVQTRSYRRAGVAPERTEDEILEKIEEMFQGCGCDVFRMYYAEHEYNLTVTKGNGTQRVIHINVHVDTVPPNEENGQPHCRLTIDGNRLGGLGVWDMKVGTMSVIDVLRRIDMPADTTVVAHFLRNEELESRGALGMLEWLHRQREQREQKPLDRSFETYAPEIMRDIRRWCAQHADLLREHPLPAPHIWYSPEINASVNVDSSTASAVTVGRAGHLKTHVLFDRQGRGGHGARGGGRNTHVPNVAAHVVSDMLDEMDRRPVRNREFGEESYLRKIDNGGGDEHHSVINRMRERFSHIIVPTTTIETSMARQNGTLGRIAGRRKLSTHKVRTTLARVPNTTSYDPYLSDTSTPWYHEIRRAADSQYHAAVDRSTSDMSLIHAAGYEGFEVSPPGADAHNDNEHTYNSGAVQAIDTLESLIRGDHVRQAQAI